MDKATFLRNRFVDIPSLNFYGQFSSSPSGEWCICWCDSDCEFRSGQGGFREQGHGFYVLYNKIQSKIILTGKLERPNQATVANNGTFCIEDWHFGEGLKSTVYVIAANGQTIIQKAFKANMFNSAISENGSYAICQTCNNPDYNDGNLLTAFALNEKKELFSKKPVTGWADQYIFLEDIPKFGAVNRDIGTYYYDVNGNFLDQDRYEQEQLTCNSYTVVILKAEEILKSPGFNTASAYKIIEAIKHAFTILPKENHYNSWAALAFKIQGLAYEFLGDKQEALSAFDAALQLNPKIGVKRRADQLRKELII